MPAGLRTRPETLYALVHTLSLVKTDDSETGLEADGRYLCNLPVPETSKHSEEKPILAETVAALTLQRHAVKQFIGLDRHPMLFRTV